MPPLHAHNKRSYSFLTQYIYTLKTLSHSNMFHCLHYLRVS
jgi:hypothetical protein